ncbi:hypothetical protein SAMN05421505_15514 [Sinosporangium album]|uniref:Uncharacterized protein n=1 Tax=Sinosporangium album TaxID=504805 RepID=A0A1G8KUJ9_9ACTN|nr:hypothetical protein [Sinosporangium album]SDI47007.1 hypothetical protein SAMN05421505_15514 [Sinosporangium album]
MPPLRIDLDAHAQAAMLMSTSPGWLIMWRPWGRTYTAWYCADPRECHNIDAPTPDELRDLMTRVERELWRASHHTRPSRPPSTGRPTGGRQAPPPWPRDDPDSALVERGEAGRTETLSWPRAPQLHSTTEDHTGG